ncbi:MAG: formylglycine-generating enzyme family protein, partial [Gemmatimonadota bacterium]
PPEGPVHRVRVDGFFMDIHAVTNERFAEFVAATGYRTLAERRVDPVALKAKLPPGAADPDPELLEPGSLVFSPVTGPVDLREVSRWWRWVKGADWRHPEGPGSSIEERGRHPVVQVAWEDAAAFANWAGGRLPTEAEWEYAARAGIEGAEHTWGHDRYDAQHPQAHIYAGMFPSHSAEPKPVGSYPPNAFGLFDMSGNVWQWTLDWYAADTYARDDDPGTATNPVGPLSGSDPRTGVEAMRVIRGGSFLCSDTYCRGYRVSARGTGAPDTGMSHIGFRLVMTREQYQHTF